MPESGCSTGGKKSRKHSKQSKKRGGNALEAAIVPFGLLAIQQWFGTRSKHRKSSGGQQKTKKRRSASRKNRK
jgi:hypothetical protein